MDDNAARSATDHDSLAHETDFASLSRRQFIKGAVMLGTGALVLSAAPFTHARTANPASWLTFDAVAANTSDTVTVPVGFRWHVVVSWGDPLWSIGNTFDHATGGTSVSQTLALGDNNDGMKLFSVGGRTLLAVNNEYVNRSTMFANRESKHPETIDDVRKGKAGHGVSILEVHEQGGAWSVVQDSPYNRRITPDTPMEITGPARGHRLLRTQFDPTGTNTLGTWNNCGCGRTPWGTFLTCEENFDDYFSAGNPENQTENQTGDQTGDQNTLQNSEAFKRYDIDTRESAHKWATIDERFDITKHPHEANRAGYVVEIDPANPTSTPKKRTALGRLKHENAEVTLTKDDRVVVYLGDDDRGEYLYKFVSSGRYLPGAPSNTGLLDAGELYVAKFADDGRGQWLALTPTTTSMASLADICIHTRLAASAVGATTMDRPEWVAVHPSKAQAYCCLTNNKDRGRKPNAGGDPAPLNGPNPRRRNTYGQIVRWIPDGDDHGAVGFRWDLFVMAGNPTVHTDARKGSANVTEHNLFNSPDGLGFDSQGGLWIRTDGKDTNTGDFAGNGNNQMLFADTETGVIKRFLVGPSGCEVTGLCWSPDRETMFVGIQHPNGTFPDGANTLPRSSVIAVQRIDNGPMG
ncbi:MAG: secreted PhoX family phosphatase [Gammaproteobacteria bacterium]|jgi:secreted PhoX family phosphatase